MTTPMSALASSSIKHSEFVKLTMPATTYRFCSAAASITVGADTFSGLGSLLSIGEVTREIRATSGDIQLSLIGVDPTNVAIILNNNIKGSLVEIWRGFFDSNNQIITTPSLQFFKRYQGIVIAVNLSEDFNETLRVRTATVAIACSSYREILRNRVAGVKTSISAWQALYPGDLSMSRVPAISNQFFDFGSPPMTQTQSADGDSEVLHGD